MLTLGGRSGDGRAVIVLGVSGENITRLVAGEPVVVPRRRIAELFPDGLGVDVTIVVYYGKTDEDLRTEIQRHVHVQEL